MPYGIYDNIECEYGEHGQFTPQEHQEQVLNYFIKKSPFKGLCLFHRLGSGKSCSSIITSDQILRLRDPNSDIKAKDNLASEVVSLNNIEKIYILTPGSLRQNFIEEYCDTCGFSPKMLRENYIFVTTNYALPRIPDFNNSLVIIDEVHNLINGAKNMSKYPLKIYNALMKSKCRILALTGTPIFNYYWEWPLLGNLLKPGTFPNIIKGGELNEGGFTKNFKINNKGDLVPLRSRLFKNKLSGIISYYPGRGLDFYPKLVKEKPILIPMIPEQYIEYEKIYTKEEKIRFQGPPKKSLLRTDPVKYNEDAQLYIMAAKYIMSRSISNFYYPSEYRKASNDPHSKDEFTHTNFYTSYVYKPPSLKGQSYKYYNIMEFMEKMVNSHDESELVKKLKDSLITGGDLKEEKIDFKKMVCANKKKIEKYSTKIKEKGEIGWVNKNTFGQRQITDKYSRKFFTIIANILNNWTGKHVIFSFFKTKAGVNMFHAMFKMCGIKSVIYSGDIGDSQRRRILAEFNSERNRYGKDIKVLLITEAGAEGINILEARHMHIVESSTREMKIQQVIGRVVRYKSHQVEGREKMPQDEQKVQIWRYWSVPLEASGSSVDKDLYSKGVYQRKTMNSFLNLLKKASVTPYKESNDTKIVDMSNTRLSPLMENIYSKDINILRKIRDELTNSERSKETDYTNFTINKCETKLEMKQQQQEIQEIKEDNKTYIKPKSKKKKFKLDKTKLEMKQQEIKEPNKTYIKPKSKKKKFKLDKTKLEMKQQQQEIKEIKEPKSKKKKFKLDKKNIKKLDKTIWKIGKQIGKDGKDGQAFILSKDGKPDYVLKKFKRNKSLKAVEKEYKFQERAAEVGVAPQVYEIGLFDGKKYPYFIMDRMYGDTLDNIYKNNNFTIPKKIDKQIRKKFEKLTNINIAHNDPNPLNFMTNHGQIYILDYGLSKPLDKVNESVRSDMNKPRDEKYGMGLYDRLEDYKKN
jgi:hypothetical protein